MRDYGQPGRKAIMGEPRRGRARVIRGELLNHSVTPISAGRMNMIGPSSWNVLLVLECLIYGLSYPKGYSTIRVCLNFTFGRVIRGRSFHSNLFSGACVHSNYKKKKLE